MSDVVKTVVREITPAPSNNNYLFQNNDDFLFQDETDYLFN